MLTLYKITFDRRYGPELQAVLVSAPDETIARMNALAFVAEDYPREVERDELTPDQIDVICSTPDDVLDWA